MSKGIGGVVAIPVLIGVGYLGLWAAESRVDARIAALTTRLAPRPHPEFDPAMFWIVKARIAAIDAYLDQRAPAREGLGIPSMWELSRRAELEKSLNSLGSFFEQVDTLLEEPQCKFVLENGLVTSAEPARLGRSRHRTNVLCARAMFDFEVSGASRAAAERLGQALDLIRLDDNGRLIGYSIATAEEKIVLFALQRMLESGRAEGAVFREVLDDRLARLGSDARASDVLRNQVSDFAEYDAKRGTPSWLTPWSRIGRLMDRRRLALGFETSLRLLSASGKESRSLSDSAHRTRRDFGDDFVWAWASIMAADNSHWNLIHVDLARRALELAANRGAIGSPPIDRYSGSPLHEKEKDQRVELRSDGALAAFHKQPTDRGAELLCWTIPR